MFVDNRHRLEELGAVLRSEKTFTESSATVIMTASTLEFGIDTGDLVRVIQLGDSRTGASFLRRLGRTDRRVGAARNCLLGVWEREDVDSSARHG